MKKINTKKKINFIKASKFAFKVMNLRLCQRLKEEVKNE